MNFLAEKLRQSNPEEVLWFDWEYKSIRAWQIVNAMQTQQDAEWRGKRVAIGKLSSLEFVCSLIFLDGLAEVILLLPEEDDDSTRASRLSEAGIDVVIEGLGLKLTHELIREKIASKTNFAANRDVKTAWILPTSGTEGRVKLVQYSLSALMPSINSVNLSKSYVWGSLYSLRRFAGLQVFLQAWASGSTLLLCDNEVGTKETLDQLCQGACNALSATPSMWRKLSMLPGFQDMKLQQITLGGEIVDQAILDALKYKFPNARITHIYASTEAGVGFAVNDCKAGFPVEFFSNPPKMVRMRIGENGNLWLTPKNLLNKDAPNESLWLDSGDAICIDSGRVYFLGRANGSINVGGNKVMPEEIESVIYELNSISFVKVSARKNSIMGNLVEALVIPASGYQFDANLKKMILDHCKSRLPSFKIPAFISRADEFKLNASGKLIRGGKL